MKYYIITGERSADLHGSNLIRALKRNDVNAHIRFWGGDLMVQAGGELVVHYQSLSLMGFWEVLKHLFKMIRFMKFCQKDLIAFQPDVLILMDFAGFNLRVAKFAKKKGLRVFYYISPKIWAWKASRVKTIKKYVDKMFVILPFEKDFYQKHNYQVDFVGNPLVEIVKHFRPNPNFLENNQLDGRPIIAVLPGSRKQEVRLILEIMLSLCEKFSNYQFVIAGVDNVERDQYLMTQDKENLKVVFNQTYDLLFKAQAAVVTSGTATLETALFDIPQVVCYKTSFLTYWIGKSFLKVDHISLVNLIAGKKVVTELIQRDLNSVALTKELEQIIDNSPKRNDMLKNYQEIKEILGDYNTADYLSELMVNYLK